MEKTDILHLIKRMSDEQLLTFSSAVKMEQDVRQRYPENARAVPRMDFERVPVAKDTVSMDEAFKTREAIKAINAADKEVLHVDTSGATSSHVPLRYDLIPRQLLYLAALRYTEGAVKHGERGYQRGFGSRDFILNRINHIYEHLNSLFHPSKLDHTPSDEDGLDGNLGAIIWGIGFLAEVSQHPQGSKILAEIIAAGVSKHIL